VWGKNTTDGDKDEVLGCLNFRHSAWGMDHGSCITSPLGRRRSMLIASQHHALACPCSTSLFYLTFQVDIEEGGSWETLNLNPHLRPGQKHNKQKKKNKRGVAREVLPVQIQSPARGSHLESRGVLGSTRRRGCLQRLQSERKA